MQQRLIQSLFFSRKLEDATNHDGTKSPRRRLFFFGGCPRFPYLKQQENNQTSRDGIENRQNYRIILECPYTASPSSEKGRAGQKLHDFLVRLLAELEPSFNIILFSFFHSESDSLKLNSLL